MSNKKRIEGVTLQTYRALISLIHAYPFPLAKDKIVDRITWSYGQPGDMNDESRSVICEIRKKFGKKSVETVYGGKNIVNGKRTRPKMIGYRVSREFLESNIEIVGYHEPTFPLVHKLSESHPPASESESLPSVKETTMEVPEAPTDEADITGDWVIPFHRPSKRPQEALHRQMSLAPSEVY